MCGICGITRPAPATGPSESCLRRMRDTLVHRGPDDAGLFLAPGVGLGHRRLSIVDVEGGHQPMRTEDGRYTIVYNGEIYNHPDLKRELESAGQRYRTRCDTETLLRLYALDGLAAIDRLRGMFAFAIWDDQDRRLVLVRDRLGIKPLYYVHAPDGSLFFASEIKALLAAEAVRPTLALDVLPDYLANHAPSGNRTLFEGVRRLPPGHALVWKDGRIRVIPYWSLSFEAPDTVPGDQELVDRFAELFREAVRLRLMSDVPLGAFLSGGIDSSAIVAVMSEMVDEPIRTFSVGFREREANELHHARAVAQAYRTEHYEVLLSPGDFFASLVRMVWHEDEPIAHPSSVALNAVSRLASQHVKVVLTGEGSDELLGGYGRYHKTLINMRLGRWYESATPRVVRNGIGHAISTLPPGSALAAKLSRTFLSRSADLRNVYLENFAVFDTPSQRDILSRDTLERIGELEPYAELEQRFAESSGMALLNRLLAVDTGVYLQELLMKQDQMSMAASIESRVPFLDHHLVEFAAVLPSRMKIRGHTTKHILRKALKPVLPPAVLKRPKAGFPVPIGSWFRGPFRHIVNQYVLSDRSLSRGLFDASALRRLVAEHESGRREHGQRLWSLVNLEIWQRLFLDERAATELPGTIAPPMTTFRQAAQK